MKRKSLLLPNLSKLNRLVINGLLCIITAIAFFAALPTKASAQEYDDDAVRGLMQQWLTAYNSKDIDALMSLYSDEIYYANNGNKLERSVESIRRNYAEQFKQAPQITISFSEELVAAGETYAHIAGKYRVNIPQTNGETAHAFGRVLLIFKKQSADWKLIVDFDNTASDISKTTF